MKAREKKLLLIVVAMVALFAATGLVYLAMVRPLQAADAQTRNLRSQLNKLRQERTTFFNAETALQKITERTFSDQLELASARSSELLTRLILQSGLSETDVTRLPLGPRNLRGAQEIGWMIQAGGPLTHLVNLLYLLDNVPQVHRIENLALSPGSASDRAKASFRWLTLVVDPAPDVEFKPLPSTATLQDPARLHYDVIIARNLFMPYQPPPPPPPTAPMDPVPASPLSGPGPETFRVVSLSEWKGQQEVHVRDLTQNIIRRYRPGEPLAGGTILMIDYRPFPKPGKEFLKSNSRVIVDIESNYWAVEEGDTLADIYQLTTEKLPPELVEN